MNPKVTGKLWLLSKDGDISNIKFNTKRKNETTTKARSQNLRICQRAEESNYLCAHNYQLTTI